MLTNYWKFHIAKTSRAHFYCFRIVVIAVLYFIHVTLSSLYYSCRARASVVVKALCYKPEGRGLGTR
jgi:hypothetical protein